MTKCFHSTFKKVSSNHQSPFLKHHVGFSQKLKKLCDFTEEKNSSNTHTTRMIMSLSFFGTLHYFWSFSRIVSSNFLVDFDKSWCQSLHKRYKLRLPIAKGKIAWYRTWTRVGDRPHDHGERQKRPTKAECELFRHLSHHLQGRPIRRVSWKLFHVDQKDHLKNKKFNGHWFVYFKFSF